MIIIIIVVVLVASKIFCEQRRRSANGNAGSGSIICSLDTPDSGSAVVCRFVSFSSVRGLLLLLLTVVFVSECYEFGGGFLRSFFSTIRRRLHKLGRH